MPAHRLESAGDGEHDPGDDHRGDGLAAPTRCADPVRGSRRTDRSYSLCPCASLPVGAPVAASCSDARDGRAVPERSRTPTWLGALQSERGSAAVSTGGTPHRRRRRVARPSARGGNVPLAWADPSRARARRPGAPGTAACFVVESGSDIGAYIWLTPFLGTYAAGLVAFRLQPQHVALTAAARLRDAGDALDRFERGARRRLTRPRGTLVAGAVERRRPVLRSGHGGSDGRPPRGLPGRQAPPTVRERRVVTIAAVLALDVPLLLLVVRESVHPPGPSPGAPKQTPPRPSRRSPARSMSTC